MHLSQNNCEHKEEEELNNVKMVLSIWNALHLCRKKTGKLSLLYFSLETHTCFTVTVE